MVEAVKRRFLRTPFGQAVLLAAIQAFGWLYITGFFQSRLISVSNLGQDMGMRYLILAWIIALGWGGVVFVFSRFLIGLFSVAGFFIGVGGSAVMAPILVLILMLRGEGGRYNQIVEHLGRWAGLFLPKAYSLIGFGILLPKIDDDLSTIFVIYGSVMFVMSLIGFYATAKRRFESRAAITSTVIS